MDDFINMILLYIYLLFHLLLYCISPGVLWAAVRFDLLPDVFQGSELNSEFPCAFIRA